MIRSIDSVVHKSRVPRPRSAADDDRIDANVSFPRTFEFPRALAIWARARPRRRRAGRRRAAASPWSSAESLAIARAETYAVVLTGGSRTLVETWGLQIADGGEFSAFRYVDAGACRVSRDAKDCERSVNAAKTGELQLWYAQAAPIAMPVGRVEVNGGARVVSPRVHAVDVFVEVDGESFSDGHVCYGADAKSSRDEAIEAACRDTPMSKTWMRIS